MGAIVGFLLGFILGALATLSYFTYTGSTIIWVKPKKG
jgi:hypothetical protein